MYRSAIVCANTLHSAQLRVIPVILHHGSGWSCSSFTPSPSPHLAGLLQSIDIQRQRRRNPSRTLSCPFLIDCITNRTINFKVSVLLNIHPQDSHDVPLSVLIRMIALLTYKSRMLPSEIHPNVKWIGQLDSTTHGSTNTLCLWEKFVVKSSGCFEAPRSKAHRSVLTD